VTQPVEPFGGLVLGEIGADRDAVLADQVDDMLEGVEGVIDRFELKPEQANAIPDGFMVVDLPDGRRVFAPAGSDP
jgi:hypothetical protein